MSRDSVRESVGEHRFSQTAKPMGFEDRHLTASGEAAPTHVEIKIAIDKHREGERPPLAMMPGPEGKRIMQVAQR